ncbi:MAG: hypothetical protein IE909_18970 [Campylobacterales bacterium]|nr:hypothetical protein [Campylobacterales bacterium]
MGFFDFLGSGIVESVGKVADDLITSDEERMEKENEKLKTNLQYNIENKKLDLEAQKDENENISKRWLSDNQNMVTRLVRPFIVVYVVVVFTAIVFLDGNIGEFKINEAYIPIFQTLLVTVIGAYFGSRGFEKVTSIKNSGAKSEV